MRIFTHSNEQLIIPEYEWAILFCHLMSFNRKLGNLFQLTRVTVDARNYISSLPIMLNTYNMMSLNVQNADEALTIYTHPT